MNWVDLLCDQRLGDASYQAKANRSMFVQDHDRIVFSAPFRRLANKTQVQPLYENDHVHHRLIHSIEVSSVGRSLAMQIGDWLVSTGEIPPGTPYDLANIVQAASVAHDIGNPPYGHSGEEAMGDWFAARFETPKGLIAEVDPQLYREFTKFEGNAQGFRILARLDMYRNAGGMRLSKATLGAFMKYPVTAAVQGALKAEGADYIGLKKFGIFSAEATLFAEAASSLGLIGETHTAGLWWRRHPLVFLVEAADDICYNIVDLEDAFTTGELPFELVRDTLSDTAGRPNRETLGMTQAEEIAMLRALAIGAATASCVEAFRQNYAQIMAGAFSAGLIEVGTLGDQFQRIKTLAQERIFTAPRKTELEISGRRVIENVMSGILPVYEDLARGAWDVSRLSGQSKRLVNALGLDLRDVISPESALHALADFTSGMTDRYALRISRMLSGI